MPFRESSELISAVMGVRYRRSSPEPLLLAVESILRQTHSELELIICERDSTEQARAALREISARDDRVIVLDGSAARSFSEQLNICLKAARGKWIARMDDDDFSHPQRFEKQLAFLREHDDIAFVGCNCELVQDGNIIGVQKFPEYPEQRDFLFNQPFIHPSVMFRREALDAVSGYSELKRCNRCEDFDLFMRLYLKGYRGANLQTPYFTYTLPANGVTTRNFTDRVNEMKTRFVCFRRCGMLPKALPYVVKPLVVWLLPRRLLAAMKRKRNLKK